MCHGHYKIASSASGTMNILDSPQKGRGYGCSQLQCPRWDFEKCQKAQTESYSLSLEKIKLAGLGIKPMTSRRDALQDP